MLAAAVERHPDELRADLQRCYGIDLDHAMAGAHTAAHVASLTACLPTDSLLFAAENPDAAWSREAILLAETRNALRDLIWGMSDPRKRGPRPKPVGPSWMTRAGMTSLPAQVLSVDELMEELAKPRTTTRGGE